MNPTVKLLACCDDVIRHADNNKMSLIGLFENINAPSFPTVHSKFAVVSRWSGGEGPFTLQVRLLDPTRVEVISQSDPNVAIFPDKNHVHHHTLYLQNTVFNIPGVYWIQALLDGDPVQEEPLNLALLD